MLEPRFHLANLLFMCLRFLLLFVADFEHVLFAGKGREKQLLLFEPLKYLTQQKIHKVTNSNPKTRCKIG